MSLRPGYVVAPGGLRHRSTVRKVPHGHTVHVHHDGALYQVADGQAIQRLVPSAKHVPDAVHRAFGKAPAAAKPGPGWVVDAGWECGAHDEIASFRATWTVPAPPKDPTGGQILFVFPMVQRGAQDGGELYQPSLQWGRTPAGGGAYWGITCWYGYAMCVDMLLHSPLVRVRPGDRLIGTVAPREMLSGIQWVCQIEVEGQPAKRSSLAIGSPKGREPSFRWCCVALEAYAEPMKPAYYPDTDRTRFADLAVTLRQGGAVTPDWKAEHLVHGSPQSVEIESATAVSIRYR